MKQAYRIEDLLSLMKKLRDPEHGCSWDRKQSLRTLTGYTLEEVYEVIDAVETGDDAQLQDELGDLLFQVVFYAQIAQEEGRFEFSEVIASPSARISRWHSQQFRQQRISPRCRTSSPALGTDKESGTRSERGCGERRSSAQRS